MALYQPLKNARKRAGQTNTTERRAVAGAWSGGSIPSPLIAVPEATYMNLLRHLAGIALIIASIVLFVIYFLIRAAIIGLTFVLAFLIFVTVLQVLGIPVPLI